MFTFNFMKTTLLHPYLKDCQGSYPQKHKKTKPLRHICCSGLSHHSGLMCLYCTSGCLIGIPALLDPVSWKCTLGGSRCSNSWALLPTLETQLEFRFLQPGLIMAVVAGHLRMNQQIKDSLSPFLFLLLCLSFK